MAETVINNNPGEGPERVVERRDGGSGVILGVVIAIIVLILLFLFVIPNMGGGSGAGTGSGAGSGGGTTIEVPDEVNVNADVK